MKLPGLIVAVDVETTGLQSGDRIVTLGAWRMNSDAFARGKLEGECIHVIFNPERKSHPRAAEVHGYSDWVLRHQSPFSEQAQLVRNFLSEGDIIVAHNASFDLGFIEREYRLLGEPPIARPHYCTMNGYRRSGRPGGASLNSICQQMGLKRMGAEHGALEDAWLALMAYFWLQDISLQCLVPFWAIAAKGIPVRPSNFVEAPPASSEPLPRNRPRVDATENKINSFQKGPFIKVLKAVRPTAVLLLEMARADKSLIELEIEIITSLTRKTADRLGLRIDDEIVQHVLDEIFKINVSQNILTRSARSVCRDLVARAEFPKWIASMVASSGAYSDFEKEAFNRVKEAFIRVLSKDEAETLTHPPSTPR